MVFPSLWGLSGVGLGRKLPYGVVLAVLGAGWVLCTLLFVNWRHLF